MSDFGNSAIRNPQFAMTMIQRLLRGRALYLILGVLAVFLYSRGVSCRPATLHEGVPSEQAGVALQWLPSTLDPATIARIAKQQPRLALALSVVSLLMIGLGLGGVLLTIGAAWSGRIRGVLRFAACQLPRWSLGEVWRVVGLTVIVAALLPFVRLLAVAYQWEWGSDLHAWMTVSMLVLDGFVILAVLAFAQGNGRSVGQMLGFSARRLWASMTVAFRGYVGVFPWMFLLLYLIAEGLRSIGFKPPMEPIQELLFQEHRPGMLGLTMLLACVVGPAAEELFFRGMVYAAIRQRRSRLAAMLASSALFSLIHTNVVGFLPIMALGCLLANLYERTGSLVSPLVIHILHNTLLMSLALIFREFLALS